MRRSGCVITNHMRSIKVAVRSSERENINVSERSREQEKEETSWPGKESLLARKREKVILVEQVAAAAAAEESEVEEAALVPCTWKKVGQCKQRTVGGKGILGRSNKWPSRLLPRCSGHRLTGTTCDTGDQMPKGTKMNQMASQQDESHCYPGVGVRG